MTIRTRLIALTVLLQLGSLVFLTGGVMLALKAYGRQQIVATEDLLRHAVARTALDALIQRDEIQLLSYLNYLKGQHPALSYALISWNMGGKTTRHTMGTPAADPEIKELRVLVADPSQPDRTVEIVFGADHRVLRIPIEESRRRLLGILVGVSVLAALAGMLAAWLFSYTLTTPLTRLANLAEVIGQGRLGARLDLDSNDEVGRLARAFNSMSERLEELEQSRRDFTSSVTHELRSPLGAIESFLQLIDAKAATGDPAALQQSRDYIKRIQTNVARLSGFINDLLDVAKIERGKMVCLPRVMDLGPTAQDVCQFFEAKSQLQGVALGNHLGALPAVMGDPDRVRQVLVNLVANALKFSKAGGRIDITAELIRDGAVRYAEITVSDDGRGMDEADRARLFRPFTQGRNVSEGVAGHQGTGLGLYIVKSIIDQHHGRIEVASAPGKGTKVLFTLPLAATPSDADGAPAA